MKSAALLILALTLSACAVPGVPATRHAAVVEEHPDFRDCAALVQASLSTDSAQRADRLNACLSRPQVAQTDL